MRETYSPQEKIEHDIIDKPVKLDILNEIPPQVNEIPRHFIHDVTLHRPHINPTGGKGKTIKMRRWRRENNRSEEEEEGEEEEGK